MTNKQHIWECRVEDGSRHYFLAKFEAELFTKDTAAAGQAVCMAPVPLPETAREFVGFMERVEQDRRRVAL